MTKDVDLILRLPPFMAEFKELTAAFKAENPEFTLAWKATDRILSNLFIETADEFGISKFENLLGIMPSKDDTLEMRRKRLFLRWFNSTPYTLKALAAKLTELCGASNFSIVKNYDFYRLEITTNLEFFGQVNELAHIFGSMLPCNIVTLSNNNINCKGAGNAFAAGTVISYESFFITNDLNEKILSTGGAFGSAAVTSEIIGI